MSLHRVTPHRATPRSLADMRTGLGRAPRAAGRGAVRTGRGVAAVGRWATTPARFVFRFLTRSPETALFVLAAILFVIAWATPSLTHDATVLLAPGRGARRDRSAPPGADPPDGRVGSQHRRRHRLRARRHDPPRLADAVAGRALPRPADHGRRGRPARPVAGGRGGCGRDGGRVRPPPPRGSRALGTGEARPGSPGSAAARPRFCVLSRRQLAIETVSTQEERKARRAVLEERSFALRAARCRGPPHVAIVVQAQSAPYRLGEVGDDAKAEFSSIEQSARAALNEVRAVLGVLRTESTRWPPRRSRRRRPRCAAGVQPRGRPPADLGRTAANPGFPAPGSGAGGIPDPAGEPGQRLAARPGCGGARPGEPRREGAQPLRQHGRTTSAGTGRETGGGSGLLGARTRAESAGGRLAAGPMRTGGFRVEAVWPVTVPDTSDAGDRPGPAANPTPDRTRCGHGSSRATVEAAAATASDPQGQ